MGKFTIDYIFEINKLIEDRLKLTLNYTKTRKVKSPEFGTSGSNGIDVFVPDDFESIILEPRHSVLIDMGIHFKIEGNYGLQVNNKSGVSVKKTLIHGAELIDQDYTGELKVHLINVGIHSQKINAGDKIVQLLPIYKPMVEFVEFLVLEDMLRNSKSERGSGGFGSTGDN